MSQDPLVLLEDLLRYRHIAPTCPSTLSSFPFSSFDPFVIQASPHIFFIGNQKSFSCKVAFREILHVFKIFSHSWRWSKRIILAWRWSLYRTSVRQESRWPWIWALAKWFLSILAFPSHKTFKRFLASRCVGRIYLSFCWQKSRFHFLSMEVKHFRNHRSSHTSKSHLSL